MAETLARIGDTWTVMVVGTLQDGPLRYNEIHRIVDGISQRMLTLTLKGLEGEAARGRLVAVFDYAIKRRTRPMLGFKTFRCAQILLAGIELMHTIAKGQVQCALGTHPSAADQFYELVI